MADQDRRYAVPCVHWLGAEQRRCEATPTRRYDQGPKCAGHTPAAVKGEPEPSGQYCAPSRCYCGRPSCPAYETYGLQDRYATHAEAWGAIDARAIASGRRRSNSQDHTAAQATIQEQKARDAAARRAHPDRPRHPVEAL